MITKEEFEKITLNKVSEQGDGKMGLYPFPCVFEGSDGKLVLVAFALDGVKEVFTAVWGLLKLENPKELYLAVDFPANGLIKTDFVAVFYYESEVWTVKLKPYNAQGEWLDEITHGVMINLLLSQTRDLIAMAAYKDGKDFGKKILQKITPIQV